MGRGPNTKLRLFASLLGIFALLRCAFLPSTIVTHNTGIKYGITLHVYQFTTINVQHLKDLGVSFVRVEVPWDEIETTKGVYNWAPLDNVATLLVGTGIGLLAITADANPIYGSRPVTNYLNPYVAFHLAMIQRYKSILVGLEICNEPDNAYFWGAAPSPAAYSQVLAALAPAVKAVDPSLVLFGGNTSGVDTQFLSVSSGGIVAYTDYFNTHPYRQTKSPETAFADLYALYQYRKPLAVTEWGYDSNVTGLAKQATYMSDMVSTLQKAGVSYFGLYALEDTVGGDCACGLLDSNGNEKPAYAAFKIAIKQ